ncbi:MAG: hypothetical protein CBC77_003340 [Euryarchaeota archaeon TMED117]|nr:MAG: hypothetical protein CBC77_003340 [Euryarchaeota archaeon TMED117]
MLLSWLHEHHALEPTKVNLQRHVQQLLEFFRLYEHCPLLA